MQTVNPLSNCAPPLQPSTPSSQIAGIEDMRWQGVRVGASGKVALTDRIKFDANVAYLPYVGVNWLDDHIARDTQNQMLGNGAGVQTELMLSYNITDGLNIGLGVRYWAMWTNVGTVQVIPGNPGGPLPNRNATELAGVFAQLGYSFGSQDRVPVASTSIAWSPFIKPSLDGLLVNGTGVYGGVEGGGAWGRSKQIGELIQPPPRLTFPAIPWFAAGGGLAGVTAGYGSQFDGILLFGVEGDMSWAGVRGSAQQIAPFPVTQTAATKENWLSTARARFGVTPANGWLVYGTGGLALADVEATVEPASFARFNQSRRRRAVQHRHCPRWNQL